jgi:hypothetical protein
MTYYEQLLQEIDKGKQGYNWGIPYTISKLNKVAKIQKGIYTLVFALAGVGKSAFVYDQHLFNTLDYIVDNEKKNIEMFTLFYNLEVENIDIIGTLATRWLSKKQKILTDSNHIFSADGVDEYIDKNVENIIRKNGELQRYIDQFDNRVAMYSYATKDKIEKDIKELLEKKEIKDEEGRIKHLPNHPNIMIQVVVDHIGLVSRGKEEKSMYDTVVNTSFMLRGMRRRFGISPVVIQQVTPQKVTFQGKETVMPDHEDLRMGKETIQDCNRAIAIGSPYRAKLESYRGYKIMDTPANGGEFIGDRLRIIDVVKNRKAGVAQLIAALFVGETGMFCDFGNTPDADKPDKIKYKDIMSRKKTTQKEVKK